MLLKGTSFQSKILYTKDLGRTETKQLPLETEAWRDLPIGICCCPTNQDAEEIHRNWFVQWPTKIIESVTIPYLVMKQKHASKNTNYFGS